MLPASWSSSSSGRRRPDLDEGHVGGPAALRLRYFHARPNGQLFGVGVENYQRTWTPGTNVATCGQKLHPSEPAPGRSCGCGFTVAWSLADLAAHAAHQLEANNLIWDLHDERHGSELAQSRRRHVETFRNGIVLAEVECAGKSEDVVMEDEPDLFYRVQYAAVRRVWLPVHRAEAAAGVQHRYGATTEVSELAGRPWLDTFNDGHAPTPESLGCALCPEPNPGAAAYPLCAVCREVVVDGALLQADRWQRTTLAGPRR